MFLSLAVTPALRAESRSYEIRPGDKSIAEFHAEDTYDAFDGTTKQVAGTIVADPAAPAAATVSVTIDLGSLDTGVGLRNREMRERYLETPKFPRATFQSVSVSAPASVEPNAPAEITVTGDFTLHGVTKRMVIPVRVVLIPEGRIHVTTRFNVHMPDFGIEVPSNVLVTVNHDVPVRLDVWAIAR